jgi:hypothetical protein
VAHIGGEGGKARAATERPRVGGSVQTWTYEPSGCVVTEAKSIWLTFDMSGRRRAQPFDCPLDGSPERRAPPHTDHEPGTVATHAMAAGSVAD